MYGKRWPTQFLRGPTHCQRYLNACVYTGGEKGGHSAATWRPIWTSSLSVLVFFGILLIDWLIYSRIFNDARRTSILFTHWGSTTSSINILFHDKTYIVITSMAARWMTQEMYYADAGTFSSPPPFKKKYVSGAFFPFFHWLITFDWNPTGCTVPFIHVVR